MALPLYLAMTLSEYRHCDTPPAHMAWMACSFSSSGVGLSNLPTELPPDSLLLLTDQLPPKEHSPQLVVEQLNRLIGNFDVAGVVLDFQRPYAEETARIAEEIQSRIPCPTAFTVPYAKNVDSILFLPPVPPELSAKEWLSNYSGREIWLEVENTGEELTLTAQGCTRQPLFQPLQGQIFADKQSLCHYTIRTEPDRAVFSLDRTPEDLQSLLAECETLGVTKAIGLYQEFR